MGYGLVLLLAIEFPKWQLPYSSLSRHLDRANRYMLLECQWEGLSCAMGLCQDLQAKIGWNGVEGGQIGSGAGVTWSWGLDSWRPAPSVLLLQVQASMLQRLKPFSYPETSGIAPPPRCSTWRLGTCASVGGMFLELSNIVVCYSKRQNWPFLMY